MNNMSKLAWPIFGIVFLILFRDPIGSQFGRLTGVSISATSFDLVLQNTAESQNNGGTYDMIKGLQKEGILALLGTGKSIQVLTYNDDNSIRLVDDFSGFLELERNDLLDTNARLEDLDLSNLQQALAAAGIQDIEVELNTRGEYAWDIIAESVNTALNP